jgi:hypothetical protein
MNDKLVSALGVPAILVALCIGALAGWDLPFRGEPEIRKGKSSYSAPSTSTDVWKDDYRGVTYNVTKSRDMKRARNALFACHKKWEGASAQALRSSFCADENAEFDKYY